MSVTTRDATPDEIEAVATPGIETWGIVIERDGEPIGIGFISQALGQAFGHDTVVDSEDPTDALRLWRALKARAKGLGIERVLVHFEETTPERLREFWIKAGFTQRLIVYEGEI